MAKSRVKKRPDGRYAMQIYIGMVDGKRKYKTVYGSTPKEVERKAQEVRIMLGKGMDVSAMRDTVEEWASRWLNVKKLTVSKKHAITCEQKSKVISQYLGKISITELRTAEVQSMLIEIAKDGGRGGTPAARRTLIEYKSIISQICEMAIESRLMDYNPVKATKIPATKPKEARRALTSEEQSWIVNTPHRAQTAAMIMMYAGLRRGELIPLTWSDIDLEKRTIRVNKSVEMVGNAPNLKAGAKSIAGNRVVNIPMVLSNYLKSVPKESFLVCPDTKGSIMTETSFRRMWESYLKDLNLKYGGFQKGASKYDPHGLPLRIPHITPHMLRHTFCTLLYLSGVDVLTARDQMGHADISTTLAIYTHLDATHKNKAIDKLDAYILGDTSQIQVSKS